MIFKLLMINLHLNLLDTPLQYLNLELLKTKQFGYALILSFMTTEFQNSSPGSRLEIFYSRKDYHTRNMNTFYAVKCDETFYTTYKLKS